MLAVSFRYKGSVCVFFYSYLLVFCSFVPSLYVFYVLVYVGAGKPRIIVYISEVYTGTYVSHANRAALP